MKLTWGDVSGGATPRNPSSAGAGIGPAQVIEEEPKSLVNRANTWLDEILELIRKIDQAVGVFLQIANKTQPIQGVTMDQPGENQPTTPGAGGIGPDALLALLDRIIEAEGDIPLSKFVAAIRNQEAWLVSHVQGTAAQQSESEVRTT